MAGHEHYERMAVGHVLGGLDEVDAAAFRAHLLDCADCRKRVNELRDIANDLARTEREERRVSGAARVEVETEARTDQDTPEATEVAPVRNWPWGVVIIGLVPLLVLGTLAWAVWQRAQTDLTSAVAASQQQVLEVLADGEQVAWDSPDPVRGNVATDGEVVALNLVGIPQLQVDEGLMVWLLDADGEAVSTTGPYLPSQVGGSLVAALSHPQAAIELVVSIEDDLPERSLTGPDGYRLLSARLPDASGGGG